MKNVVTVFFLITIGNVAQSQSSKIYFTSKEITRVAVQVNYYYRFNAVDSNGNSILYSLKKLPSWLEYNSNDHSIFGKSAKPGQFPINIIALAKTDTVHQHFMVTVFNKQTKNILCLGNSITNGVDTFNSYRRNLWQMLHVGNYNFDFIGSWSKHAGGTAVPIPDFDMDHEGHSGWTFEDILKPPSWDSASGNLHEWINEYTPDIVLIELGTNDVFQCRTPKEMFGNLDDILTLLREKNNNVKIFLAQIPPLGAKWSDKKLCGRAATYDDDIVNLNKQIASYALEHSTNESPIKAVDQYTGVDPSKDMFDDIHPNTIGEKIMAERWFQAIKGDLKKL